MTDIRKNIIINTRPEPKQHKNLLRAILASDGTASSRRFTTLIFSLFVILMMLTFLVLLVLTYTRRVYASQQTINLFFTLFQEMARWCIYIILIGSGLVTASQLFGVMDTRAKAGVIRAAAGMPDTAVTQQVDQQNVNVQNGENTEIKSSVTHDSGKLDAENEDAQNPAPTQGAQADGIDQNDPDHPANIARRQQAANDNKQTTNAVQPKE